MKMSLGLLLCCAALIGSVRTVEAAPVKKDAPLMNQELVWPEIKDPQALIAHAKTQIEEFNRKHPGVVQNLRTDIDHEFDYLKPRECWVSYDRLCVVFDTHPFTGQGLLIAPDTKDFWERHDYWRAGAIDTKSPAIKYVLGDIDPSASGRFEYLVGLSVRWADFRNLDKESRSWPKPLTMRFPDYPYTLVDIGVDGSAKVELTVTEQGTTVDLDAKCTQKEMEPLVLEAMRNWRFEPGVDLKTRLPARTRISLAVIFTLKQE